MGTERTAWHVLFAALIEERAPPDVEVVVEHVLTVEPQKVDLLLIRRGAGERRDEAARVLRRLWPELTAETLIEFKSIGRPTRRGDWIRLLGYAAQHHSKRIDRIDLASELTLVLVVPSLTPTILREARSLGWSLVELGGGYYRVRGSEYPGLLAVLADIADAERDDLIRVFAGAKLEESESARWIMTHSNTNPEGSAKIEDLEGYAEIMRAAFDKLPIEETLLWLPDKTLAALSAEYVATLPESVQAAIRKRLSH